MEKHSFMNKVLDKARQVKEEVKYSKEIFKKHFEKGLPSFWDINDKLFSKDNYNTLLTPIKMDHSKFEHIKKGLNGEVIINKLSDDLNILDKFQVIKSNLSPLSISSCVELYALLREMMDYEIPS